MLAVSTVAGETGSSTGLERRLQYDDLAALKSREPHAELSCQVTSDKPSLGFDLRFHSDYHAAIPVNVVADAGGWLEVVMRVVPASGAEPPTYLANRFAIPISPPGSKGEVLASGGFDLGPGRYRVDWIMSDARERVCSAHWNLDARLGSGKEDLPLTLGTNQIVDLARPASANGPLIKREFARTLQVKILLNLSPAKPQESIVRAEDAAVLLSILRGLADQPRIVLSTVVAFNLRGQKIVYRQEHTDQVDFLALEKAAQSPASAPVDLRVFRDAQSDLHFVTRLLTQELGAQADSPDAVILVGPKVSLDRKVPLDSLQA